MASNCLSESHTSLTLNQKLEMIKLSDDRGWEGWMALLTPWTWVWVNSGSWWWTGSPGVLWFMGVTKSRTRLSDWTELNWTEGMSKDKMGWKLGLLHKTVSQECNAKVLERNLKSCSSEDVNDKIVKQPYCWYKDQTSLNILSQSLIHSQASPNALQFHED